jgi:hypothetical protein
MKFQDDLYVEVHFVEVDAEPKTGFQLACGRFSS